MPEYALPSYAPKNTTGGDGGSGGLPVSNSGSASWKSTPGSGGFTNQFSAFPEWMPPNANTDQLTKYQGQIPGLFNAKPMVRDYKGMMNSMMAQGRGGAAAAANAYTQRAMQSGASGMGASFAQNQAMLPYFNQQAGMQSELSQLQMKNRQMKSGALYGAASDIDKLNSQQGQSMMRYALEQQRLAQAGQQWQGQMDYQSEAAKAAQRASANGGGKLRDYLQFMQPSRSDSLSSQNDWRDRWAFADQENMLDFSPDPRSMTAGPGGGKMGGDMSNNQSFAAEAKAARSKLNSTPNKPA